VQSSKKNTLEQCISRHGPEYGLEVYQRKNLKSAITIDNFVNRYGETKGRLAFISAISGANSLSDFIEFCVNLLRQEPTYVCENFPSIAVIMRTRTAQVGIKAFDLSEDGLLNLCKEYDPMINSMKHIKSGGKYGSYMAYTEDGQFLRSGGEMAFYIEIKRRFPHWPISIGWQYPESNLRYDFYLPEIDTYVEIAGLMRYDSYRAVIDEKITKFNCLVIGKKRMRDMNEVINELEKRYEILG